MGVARPRKEQGCTSRRESEPLVARPEGSDNGTRIGKGGSGFFRAWAWTLKHNPSWWIFQKTVHQKCQVQTLGGLLPVRGLFLRAYSGPI